MLSTNHLHAARKWQVRLLSGSTVQEIQLVRSYCLLSKMYLIIFRTYFSKLSQWFWYHWSWVWMGGQSQIWNQNQGDLCPGWHGRGLWAGLSECLWHWKWHSWVSRSLLWVWRGRVPSFIWQSNLRWTCYCQVRYSNKKICLLLIFMSRFEIYST